MAISIGTSCPPSVRDTHTAWLRRRCAPDAAVAGGAAAPERGDPAVQHHVGLGQHIGGARHIDLEW